MIPRLQSVQVGVCSPARAHAAGANGLSDVASRELLVP
jgi:hypothetical protein